VKELHILQKVYMVQMEEINRHRGDMCLLFTDWARWMARAWSWLLKWRLRLSRWRWW